MVCHLNMCALMLGCPVDSAPFVSTCFGENSVFPSSSTNQKASDADPFCPMEIHWLRRVRYLLRTYLRVQKEDPHEAQQKIVQVEQTPGALFDHRSLCPGRKWPQLRPMRKEGQSVRLLLWGK